MIPKLTLTIGLAALMLVATHAAAQTTSPPTNGEPSDTEFLLVSVQLMVTYEEIADTNTVGINLTPLVLEVALTDWVGIRTWPIFNMLFSERGTERGHLGGALAVPFYYWGDSPANRWYAGPVVSYVDNPVVDGSDLLLGAEAGLRWEIAQRWSFNVALHLGASRLAGNRGTKWVNHFGVFPSIGYWF